jgi:hypothetical protein
MSSHNSRAEPNPLVLRQDGDVVDPETALVGFESVGAPRPVV